MKFFSKKIAVFLSAFLILLCSVPAIGAVKAAPCSQIKTIRCSTKECGNAKELLEKLCNNRKICLNDILKVIGNYNNNCNNCNVNVPDTTNQPTESPTQAVNSPTESVVIPTESNIEPTESAVVPTESTINPGESIVNPVEPTEKSDESVVAPTEPAVKPTQPVVAPTEPTVKPTEPVVPTQPQGSEFNTAYEAEVLRLINIERAKYGLDALSMDDGAVKVAHLRAKEIVQSFSHTRPDGSSCFTAAKEFGVSYRTAGENIAYGYKTPEQVVTGWMNSQGHRKNILSSSFSKIGIGCYENRGVLYWSQFFIG